MSGTLKIATTAAVAGLLIAGASAGAAIWHRTCGQQVRSDDPQLERSGRAWIYKGSRLNGLVIDDRSDGSEARMPVVNGLLQGTVRSWYRGGALQSERDYLAGQKNGPQHEWWPDGAEKMSATLVRDVPQGRVEIWYASGQLSEEHFYIDGQESGHQRAFEPDGELRANYIVEHGRRYGFVSPKPCTESDLAEVEP